ncbi:MAG: hypothetical protein AAF633_01190 [Chloroflexota bacterium]
MAKKEKRTLTDQEMRKVSERVYQLMLADLRLNRERLGLKWKKRRLSNR